MHRNADFGAWLRALCAWLLAMGIALALGAILPQTVLAQERAPQRFSAEATGEGDDVIPGLATPLR